jgi:hypothetical protein
MSIKVQFASLLQGVLIAALPATSLLLGNIYPKEHINFCPARVDNDMNAYKNHFVFFVCDKI